MSTDTKPEVEDKKVIPSEIPEAAPASGPPANPVVATGTEAGASKDDEYFELLKLFVDTFEQVERNYVKDVSRRELMEAAIQGMLSKLDQHSNFIAPKDYERFQREVENEFAGIGVQVNQDPLGLLIVSPIFGTPAHRAGLVAGDRIVEIEGTSTKGMELDEAIRRLKGPTGSSVKIGVLRATTEATEKMTVQRELVRVETVLGVRRNADGSWDYLLDADRKIAYVRLSGFGRHTSEDLQKTLEALQMQGLRGLVLDLRFNPGGLLSAAISISDMFVSSGRIVSTSGRSAPERKWDARAEGTFEGFPMAVVVNRFSASASEIVAACLQDHDRAVVVGERTWGKGSVQNVIRMEAGKSALKLTTAGYLRPSGKNIHRFDGATLDDDWGVRPNDGFEVKLEDDEVSKLILDRREREILPRPGANSSAAVALDSQLRKAIDYLHDRQDHAVADD